MSGIEGHPPHSRAESVADIQEERRLLFVATPSEERLFCVPAARKVGSVAPSHPLAIPRRPPDSSHRRGKADPSPSFYGTRTHIASGNQRFNKGSYAKRSRVALLQGVGSRTRKSSVRRARNAVNTQRAGSRLNMAEFLSDERCTWRVRRRKDAASPDQSPSVRW